MKLRLQLDELYYRGDKFFFNHDCLLCSSASNSLKHLLLECPETLCHRDEHMLRLLRVFYSLSKLELTDAYLDVVNYAIKCLYLLKNVHDV